MGSIRSQETKVLNVTQDGKKKKKKENHIMGQISWFLRENRKEKREGRRKEVTKNRGMGGGIRKNARQLTQCAGKFHSDSTN